MKKVFMLMAVAAFFSMTTIACGEEKAAEGENTENAEGGEDHAEGDGHEAH